MLGRDRQVVLFALFIRQHFLSFLSSPVNGWAAFKNEERLDQRSISLELMSDTWPNVILTKRHSTIDDLLPKREHEINQELPPSLSLSLTHSLSTSNKLLTFIWQLWFRQHVFLLDLQIEFFLSTFIRWLINRLIGVEHKFPFNGNWQEAHVGPLSFRWSNMSTKLKLVTSKPLFLNPSTVDCISNFSIH